MESQKTPGTNGLPTEFYKVFLNWYINHPNYALNYAYETGQLSITHLPREEELLSFFQRKMLSLTLSRTGPLTLLNCDYKLAAKSNQ